MLEFIRKYISYKELLIALVCLASLNSYAVKSNSAQTPESPYGTLIKNVMIVSVENNAVSPEMDVLIKKGRIVEIAENISNNFFRKLQVVEGTGLYMTAGLIDSNTHIGRMPGMSLQHMRENPELRDLAQAQFPLSYLFHGFTTLVDLNASEPVVANWNSLPIRPDAYHCGNAPVLKSVGGQHAAVDDWYNLLPYFLMEKGQGNVPKEVDAKAHTPSAVIKQIKDGGGVCIRTQYNAGPGSKQYWANPSVELLEELVAKAQEAQLPVIIQTNSQSAAQVAVAAGVDAIVQGLQQYSEADVAEVDASLSKLKNSMLARNISWQPAMESYYGAREPRVSGLINKAEFQHVLPANLLSWYKSEAAQRFDYSMNGMSRVSSNSVDDSKSRTNQALSQFANSGGSVLFGSNSPEVTIGSAPGLSGRMEMTRWQQAGVEPLRFLEAATIANARFFGLEDELGSVATGKKANLVLLSRNPAESYEAWDSIQFVVVNGRVVNRGMLSALVSF